jgi:hypothetical protein
MNRLSPVLLSVVGSLLSVGAVTDAQATPLGLTEQGPVYVCFDENEPPSEERLAKASAEFAASQFR